MSNDTLNWNIKLYRQNQKMSMKISILHGLYFVSGFDKFDHGWLHIVWIVVLICVKLIDERLKFPSVLDTRGILGAKVANVE
jgi:uncharacterized membrane protein